MGEKTSLWEICGRVINTCGPVQHDEQVFRVLSLSSVQMICESSAMPERPIAALPYFIAAVPCRPSAGDCRQETAPRKNKVSLVVLVSSTTIFPQAKPFWPSSDADKATILAAQTYHHD